MYAQHCTTEVGYTCGCSTSASLAVLPMLLCRWLYTFGPGTADDIVWWLGATQAIVKAALAEVGAVQVSLDGPVATGWLLPADVAEVAPVEPWAALLPVLDPTIMGGKHRQWLLGQHAEAIFDRNGNAGTTAWWGSRVVGCWVQGPDGTVHVSALEDLPAEATAALQARANELTAWLDGVCISTVYPSPAMKAAKAAIAARSADSQRAQPDNQLEPVYASQAQPLSDSQSGALASQAVEDALPAVSARALRIAKRTRTVS